jgi:hypothetical protein
MAPYVAEAPCLPVLLSARRGRLPNSDIVFVE